MPTLAAWNAADEAAALEAMMACCGSKRWADGDGRASSHRQRAGAERGGGPCVEHHAGAGLAGSLRLPSAHRRAQGRRTQSGAIGRVVETGAVVRQIRPANACWPSLPRANELYEAALRLHLHRVRYRQERRRDARDSSSAAWPATAMPSCARRPSSSGRSCRFV